MGNRPPPVWFGAWRALPAQPKSLWHAPGYTSSETEQDPLVLPLPHVFSAPFVCGKTLAGEQA